MKAAQREQEKLKRKATEAQSKLEREAAEKERLAADEIPKQIMELESN